MMSLVVLSERRPTNEVGEDAKNGPVGNDMSKFSWVCLFVVGFLILLYT